jgi:Short C-terminal domain
MDAPETPETPETPDTETSATPTTRRRRRALVTVLFAVAVITGLMAMFAVWVNRQALNTENWTQTSSDMLADPEIQQALGPYLVDELFGNVDVAGRLQTVLPEQAAGLAGPAAAGLRQLANRVAPQVLARPRVQQAWRQANETAHKRLLRVIEGGGPVVSTEGGDVVLNVRTLVDELAARVGVADQVAGAREKLQGGAGAAAQQKLGVTLPSDTGQIVVLQSDQLETAQNFAKAIRGLAIVLTVVSLGLFALAVWLAEGWRRLALRTTGWCFVGLGLVVLFARRVGGDRLIDTLVTSESVQPAAHSAWLIGTSLLYDIAVAMFVYGLLFVAAAWLTGATRPAIATRRALAPALRDRLGTVYGVAAILFLLVLLWGPTPATRQVVGIVLLAALIVLGIETLRRQTRREFPDAEAGETLRRLRERVNALRGGRRRGAAAPPASTPQPVSVDELERLVALHDRGALDDEEFRRHKELLLHGS